MHLLIKTVQDGVVVDTFRMVSHIDRERFEDGGLAFDFDGSWKVEFHAGDFGVKFLDIYCIGPINRNEIHDLVNRYS